MKAAEAVDDSDDEIESYGGLGDLGPGGTLDEKIERFRKKGEVGGTHTVTISEACLVRMFCTTTVSCTY